MIIMETGTTVMPGDRVAAEEEAEAGNNTFVDQGSVYAATMGKVALKDGRIDVVPFGRDIRRIERDTLVIGNVTDDMRSVIFVKIDDISSGNKEFLAMKDGKIVLPKPKPRFGRHGGADSRPRSRTPEKLCGTGDTIVARVQYDDKDSYALGFDTPETGVVYAKCELCNSELDLDWKNGVLVCRECRHVEHRKISELYGKPEEVIKLFA